MRNILALSAMTAVLVLAGAALAGDAKPDRDAAKAPSSEGPMSTRADADTAMAEPCWGDRYEKDSDLNEGFSFTTEEILRIINPVQS